jgi:hypothetical protein
MPLVYLPYTKVRMIPASIALCIILGIAIERLTRRRPAPERRSEIELDRFIADLKRDRDEDATQVVRSR